MGPLPFRVVPLFPVVLSISPFEWRCAALSPPNLTRVVLTPPASVGVVVLLLLLLHCQYTSIVSIHAGRKHKKKRRGAVPHQKEGSLRLTPLIGACVAFLLFSVGWKCFLLFLSVGAAVLPPPLGAVLLSSLAWCCFPSPPRVVLVQKKRTNKKT